MIYIKERSTDRFRASPSIQYAILQPETKHLMHQGFVLPYASFLLCFILLYLCTYLCVFLTYPPKNRAKQRTVVLTDSCYGVKANQ